MAAIAMEEVLPSSVADAEALAPEEVYAKKRGRDAEFLEGDNEISYLYSEQLLHHPFAVDCFVHVAD